MQEQDMMATLAAIREANNGVIESKQAQERGIPQAELSRLCAEGQLVRISRGQFVLPKDRLDDMVQVTYDRPVRYSHQSALFLHGLLDEPGQRYQVTMCEGVEPDQQVAAACDVHHVPADVYDLGRTLAPTRLGNLVPAYDLERSVCDIALARDEVGPNVFLTVITKYAQDSRYDEQKLYEYGDVLNVSDVIRSYLEVFAFTKTLG